MDIASEGRQPLTRPQKRALFMIALMSLAGVSYGWQAFAGRYDQPGWVTALLVGAFLVALVAMAITVHRSEALDERDQAVQLTARYSAFSFLVLTIVLPNVVAVNMRHVPWNVSALALSAVMFSFVVFHGAVLVLNRRDA